MKLVLVRHLHGAVALDRGRTPIRVVATGWGRLVVGDVAVWVKGAVDRTFLVVAQDLVRVRCRGPLGGDETLLRLVTFAPPVEPKARAAVRAPDAPRAPVVVVPSIRAAVAAPVVDLQGAP